MSLVAQAVQTRNASFIKTGRTDLIVVRYSGANNGLRSNSRFRVQSCERKCVQCLCACFVCSPPSFHGGGWIAGSVSRPVGFNELPTLSWNWEEAVVTWGLSSRTCLEGRKDFEKFSLLEVFVFFPRPLMASLGTFRSLSAQLGLPNFSYRVCDLHFF